MEIFKKPDPVDIWDTLTPEAQTVAYRCAATFGSDQKDACVCSFRVATNAPWEVCDRVIEAVFRHLES